MEKDRKSAICHIPLFYAEFWRVRIGWKKPEKSYSSIRIREVEGSNPFVSIYHYIENRLNTRERSMHTLLPKDEVPREVPRLR